MFKQGMSQIKQHTSEILAHGDRSRSVLRSSLAISELKASLEYRKLCLKKGKEGKKSRDVCWNKCPGIYYSLSSLPLKQAIDILQ